MKNRLEIQAEERERTERAEQERLRHGGGGMGLQQSGERIQPSIFMIGLTLKLIDKVGSFCTWTKQMPSWAVSNTCESAFKETEHPIVFQDPNAKSREELDFQFGRKNVALLILTAKHVRARQSQYRDGRNPPHSCPRWRHGQVGAPA